MYIKKKYALFLGIDFNLLLKYNLILTLQMFAVYSDIVTTIRGFVNPFGYYILCT